MLTFDRVSFSYRAGQPVLNDLSFHLPPRGRMSIMGPSGCGKSTLLALAAGLQKPTGGRILCNAKRIACIFQEPRLFPWLTVADNLAVILPRPDPVAIAGVLEQVGLSGCAGLYPNELSGGMKIRVALARGLLYGGDLYLLDEPFSALDPALRHRLTCLLDAHLERSGAAALLVTHQREDATRFGGRIQWLT